MSRLSCLPVALSSSFVRAVALATLLAHSGFAARSWNRTADQNFDLYTTASRDHAAAMLDSLEHTRALLRDIQMSTNGSEFPVRVIVFDSPSDYGHYALNKNADAYFLSRLSGDSIVLQESQMRNPSILIHEYSHYLVHQAGVKLPLWLLEGLAELYATAVDHKSEVTIGTPARGRAEALQGSQLIPIDELFSATNTSLAAQDRQRLALFYSESWALVHMLKLTPGYRSKFDQLLDLLRAGTASPTALNAIWGKRLFQVEADLFRYTKDGIYPTLLCQGQQHKDGLNLRDNRRYWPLTSDESELVLLRLQAQLHRYTEPEESLLCLTRRLAPVPHVEEELAYLYLERRDYKEAGWYCQRAIAHGSGDPRLYVYYARILEYFQVEAVERVRYLETALALKPDFNEARLELAHTTGGQRFTKSVEVAGL